MRVASSRRFGLPVLPKIVWGKRTQPRPHHFGSSALIAGSNSSIGCAASHHALEVHVEFRGAARTFPFNSIFSTPLKVWLARTGHADWDA